MMRCSLVVMTAWLLGGCQDDAPATERVSLGEVSFEVPAGWSRVDRVDSGAAIATWTPAHNAGRESIVVVRAPRPNPGRAATPEALGPQLVTASQGLRGARLSGYRTVTTPHGLRGAQLDVQFTPGPSQTYHRTHAVVAESEASLVHVIYTAQRPAATLRPERLVLATLRRAGGRS